MNNLGRAADVWGQGVASSNLASPTVKDLGRGFGGLHEGSQDVEMGTVSGHSGLSDTEPAGA